MYLFTRLFILLMLGFFALGTGFFILFLHPYDFMFRQKVVLSDGGEIFDIWRKPSVDLYIRIYLFNVTNAEEFMAGNQTKLNVKEVGPFVYKEALEHKVLKFNSNGTLSAIPYHPLTWIEELSEGNKENDTLFLPHIALLSIANVVSKESFVTRFGLNNLISMTSSKPLVKMTAREFMMGYESKLLSLGNTFMPGWIYFDKLGLIDRMYDFKGDYETIFTGENDVRTSGLIDTYRGSTDLPQWKGKYCSNVQYASDGTKFMGGMGKNDTMLFFRKSLCRAAPLVPMSEGVKSGLRGMMYRFPDNMIDNGKYNENNKCFCRKGKCLPSGLIDVTDCYYGFPIALSYPHFYMGDEVLSSKVEGLTPNKELHETRFWIQPESGLPLDVSAKFQINMALEDVSSITNTGGFSNMYLPLLWFDIRMYTLPSSLEARFQLYLNIIPIVEQSAIYILFITGSLFIIFTVYRLTFKIMFKSFDAKKTNFIIGKDLWIDDKRDTIYSPCEVPLDSESESDPQFDDKPIKINKLRELSSRLSDKVYDSVGSVKDRVRDLSSVKNIFSDRNDLVVKDDSQTNDAYKSDSNDSDDNCKYKSVQQTDSDDDCKYLEVIDDGSEFDEPRQKFNSERSKQLSNLDNQTILSISD